MSTDRPSPLDPTGPPPPSSPEAAASPPPPRGMVLCGIVALSGFIMYQGPSLWDEVASLREDLANNHNSVVVGYVGISPNPSGAQPPGDWFREEGQEIRLWGGWHPEQGHRWFLARSGDLDRGSMSKSMGRDLFQGIDRPMVEVGGGPISGRIPGGHEVDAMILDGLPCAYPVLLLDKVLVVNDRIDGTPLLVVYTNRGEAGSSVFETTIDGDRRSMGFSGYIYKGRPLLYERASEGLWLEQEEGLVSLSGPDRGRVLKRIARMHRINWSHWSRSHEDGRVLVGADRTVEAASL